MPVSRNHPDSGYVDTLTEGSINDHRDSGERTLIGANGFGGNSSRTSPKSHAISSPPTAVLPHEEQEGGTKNPHVAKKTLKRKKGCKPLE